MVFPELDFQIALGGQNIHRQAAVPEGDAELEFGLAFQPDFAATDGDLEDAVKGGFGDVFGIEQAEPPYFYCKFLQVAAHELHHDVDLLRRANRNSELTIFKFS